jgi:toxin YoeB
MEFLFTSRGWEDYAHWLQHHPPTVRKIHRLLQSIRKDPYTGMGKPEPLKYRLHGMWSRRIDQEHRLIYRIVLDAEKVVRIDVVACLYHYH